MEIYFIITFILLVILYLSSNKKESFQVTSTPVSNSETTSSKSVEKKIESVIKRIEEKIDHKDININFKKNRKNFCSNHGEAQSKNGKCVCVCDKGYFGPQCENKDMSTTKAPETTTSVTTESVTTEVPTDAPESTPSVDVKRVSDVKEVDACIITEETYYRNIMESCAEGFNKSFNKQQFIELKQDIDLFLDTILSYYNKKDNARVTRVYIEKFVRTQETDSYRYETTALLFNMDTYSTEKYLFDIVAKNNKITLKRVNQINAVIPINRFTCDDEDDCSERESSLKPIYKSNYVDNQDPTELEYSSFNIPETANKNVNRNKHIPLVDESNINVFPCRTLEHSWNYKGIHKINPPDKTCYGVNSGVGKRALEPFYHVSMFNNLQFNDQSIDNTYMFDMSLDTLSTRGEK
jgi:hypothetical protein